MRKQMKLAFAALLLLAGFSSNLFAKADKNKGTTVAVVVDQKTYEKIPA
jgi:hypothetical protein